MTDGEEQAPDVMDFEIVFDEDGNALSKEESFRKSAEFVDLV